MTKDRHRSGRGRPKRDAGPIAATVRRVCNRDNRRRPREPMGGLLPLHSPQVRYQCSICSKAIDVHHLVRGGTCGDASCRAMAAKRAIARQYAEHKAASESIARKHLPTLLASSQLSEDELTLIALPGSTGSLQPPAAERRERFRESVTAAVAASTEQGYGSANEPLADADNVSPPAVLAAACKTCRGLCCRAGGDSAYIDEATVRRVRAQRSGLSDADIVALYMNAIPERTVQQSCILHGAQGCALPRELRSHVCNDFYCRPLREWEREVARIDSRPAAIVVLHENQVIRSTLVSE